jgi:hypothetical protein
MAYLGKYYSHKIAGAQQLALFRETGFKQVQERAVEQLTKAAEFWRLYIAIARRQYKNPLWTNRVGYVDWGKLTEWVQNDIVIAREAVPSKKPAGKR